MKRRRITLETINRRLIKMSQQLDHLTAAVQAEKTADASAIALIQGLSQQLRDALAKPDPSAAIEQLASDLDASQAALAAAVAANTPAADPAPDTAPPADNAPQA